MFIYKYIMISTTDCTLIHGAVCVCVCVTLPVCPVFSPRGRFGLWLHSDLLRGRSQRCETFDNDVLSSEEDFMISDLEVWALV